MPGIRYVVDPGTARDLALQPPAQGAAAADRADLAGLGQPAGRPLRPRRRRHLHPALLRGRLRRPAGVHRAGDPAHQPGVGHPADDRARPRRHRRVPVRRAARPPPGRATASRCSRSSARSTRAQPGRRASGSPPLGRQLARLPVDPRLARMVLEADRNGCVREVLVIAAALSIQDPRERPPDQQQAADAAHRRFADDRLGLPRPTCNLWRYLREQQKALSSQRVPPDVPHRVPALPAGPRVAGPVGQLRQVAKSLGIGTHRRADAARRRPAAGPPGAAGRAAVAHRPAGRRSKREYLGARGARFAICPARRCSRSRRAG